MLSATENQFAPFRINCVQFPRICLFHSLQMRLWTNNVTLKISLVNPFLDAWQSLCFAHKVENKSCLYSTLYFSVLVNENVFLRQKVQHCQVMNLILLE